MVVDPIYLDAYWKQRYSFHLCKLGDDARLHRNQIKILHSEGHPFSNHGDKERILHEFYTSLLGCTPLSPGIWLPDEIPRLPAGNRSSQPPPVNELIGQKNLISFEFGLNLD
jgi:hypothetical protein